MTSQQYEELCRFFIAEQLKMDLSQVVSRNIANPRREPEPDGCDPKPGCASFTWVTFTRLHGAAGTRSHPKVCRR